MKKTLLWLSDASWTNLFIFIIIFFSIIFLSFWFNYFFNSLLWSSLSHCKYYNSISPHQKMTGICVVHCMEKNRLQLPPVSPVDTKVIFHLHSPSHSHHFEFQCITNCICSCSSLSFCLIPLFVPVGYLSFSWEKPRFEQIKCIITNGSHIHVVCSKLPSSVQETI